MSDPAHDDAAPETPSVSGALVVPEAEQPEAPLLPLLSAPADGLPPLTTTPAALEAAAEALAGGTGPVAVDAERASGYRYGQDAQLVQLRRAGSGTVLVDPQALPDLAVLQEALGSAEWVLHAASQDLACLAGVGLRPGGALFDTELAGRLAGYERVGLGAVVERLLGVRLAKEHSAVDWSTRPLPEPWLLYAALDVELLVDLRDALASDLADQGKRPGRSRSSPPSRDAPPAPPRTDPWRRTSGLHAVRQRRQLAAVRELWLARDDLARRRDTAPGRILPDRAIVDAAQAMPTTARELTALPVFSGRANRRRAPAGSRRSTAPEPCPTTSCPRTRCPPRVRPRRARGRTGTRRPPSGWPAPAPSLTAVSEELRLPVENLVSPDAVRRLCWQPSPAALEGDPAAVAGQLADAGARPWQRELVAGPLAAVLPA